MKKILAILLLSIIIYVRKGDAVSASPTTEREAQRLVLLLPTVIYISLIINRLKLIIFKIHQTRFL